MTTRRGRGAAASLLLAVLLALAALVVGAGSAGASTRTEPLHVTFDGLLPGAQDADHWRLRLARDAVLTEASTSALRPGGVEWDVELVHAPTGRSVTVTPAAAGTRLSAGEYELWVHVRALDSIAPGSRHTLVGHLVFADAGATGPGAGTTAPGQRGDGPLAMTGASALPLLLSAIAAALVGLLLLAAARRRREDDTPVPVPVPAEPQEGDLP